MIDWPIIAVRFASYLCLALLFGLPLFRWHALARADRAQLPQRATRRILLSLAMAAFALAAAGLWLNCARMAGLTILALDLPTVEMIVTQTPIGTAWQVQMGALAIAVIAAACSLQSDRAWLTILLAIAAGTAIASLAWAGHGASAEGIAGAEHLAADVVHLLAMAVWLGALAGFGGLLFGQQTIISHDQLAIAARALSRFAITGSFAVAAIVVSGLVNGLMLMDITHPAAIISSLYGQLLIAKLGLFAVMLVLAAANRFRLTPSLARTIASGDTRTALSALRRSLALESGAAIVILAVVSWLGTLAPPATA